MSVSGSGRRGRGQKPAGATRTLHFEAALTPTGDCFRLNSEGEARLTIVVPTSAAKPLSEAMAAGWLRDTSFIVTITVGET